MTTAFDEALDRLFPGAVGAEEYVARTKRSLEQHGFTADNTLACVAVCRDEIAMPFVTDVEHVWGPSFGLASLAGMVTAGRTGLTAALHHGPSEGGRQRLVVYAMPHIAIGASGITGEVVRQGVPNKSSACGALIAFRTELLSGILDLAMNRYDVEQSMLKQRLLPMIGYGDVPSLAEMTRLAADAVEADLFATLELLETDDGDTASAPKIAGGIFTGIQIHGPDDANFVWPRSAHTVIDGTWVPPAIERIT